MARHWCFTINNYESTDLWNEEVYEYMVVGEEVGEEGTPHLQGYVYLKKRKELSAMKKLLPRSHLEVMKTNSKAASDYCKKDGKYKEFGTLPNPKNQTKEATKKRKADYALAVDLAKKQRLYDIEPDMLLRHGPAIRMICKDHPLKFPPLDYLPGIWLFGPSGIGKSKTARWLYPDAYDKCLNKWWDGYQHEDYVILDDFDDSHKCLGNHLKRWVDHYSFTAEQKGTSISIRPKIVCVTSQLLPCEIWSGPLLAAISRRFTLIDVGKCLAPSATPLWDAMLLEKEV